MKRSKYKLLLTTFMGTLALTLSANFTYSQLVTRAYGDVNTSSNIDLQLSDNNTGTAVQNNLTLTNNGDAVDLSKVTIRYYFTSSNSAVQTFNCYDGSITSGDTYENIASYIKGNFVKLDTPLKGADTYLEISFNKEAGTFNSSDVLKLQTSISNNDWSSFDSSDDYSFNDSSKAVVLIDGQAIKGTIPTEKSQSINTPVETKKDMTVAVSEDSSESSNSVNPTFTITNTGNCDLDLKDVNLRYYYTADSDAEQNFSCYYAGTIDGDYISLTSAVIGNTEKLETPVDNADSCLNLTFSEGILKAGQSMKVQTNINKADWSSFDKSNDYSYNDSDKIVASIAGSVISGTSPIKDVNKEDEAPKLTIGGVTGKGGDTISVPINLSNIKDKGISKFHVKISYDPSIMSLAGCIRDGDMVKDLPYAVFTGKWHNSNEHTIDIGFDFTKAEDVQALYEDGDYIILDFKLANDVEDGSTSLNIVTDPAFTDASGKDYDSECIKLENDPINLLYNPETIKNSIVYKNYLTYDEKTLDDVTIPLKLYENTIKNIHLFSDDLNLDLNEGVDYVIDNNDLILKKGFLNTLLDKNAVLSVNFTAGDSKGICINNKDFEQKIDTNRCGFSNEEANIAVGSTNTFESLTSVDTPLTFVITNTSDVDIDLSALAINYYYHKPDIYTQENFKVNYAGILGSDKYVTPSSYVDPYPCDYYCNENNTLVISAGSRGEVLKPGETLLINGGIERDCSSEECTSSSDYTINLISPITVTYNDSSIYGSCPKIFSRDSKVVPDSIELDSENVDDTSIALQVNGNFLNSISEYKNGSLEKTLQRDTDYVVNKRNEVILKKSFLDSLDSKYASLDFTFSRGHDDTLEIINHKFDNELQEGTLTLSNTQSVTFGETGICGGSDTARWNDLTVPITISDIEDEDISSGILTLKYDKNLFSNVQVKNKSYMVSPSVNQALGTITIKLSNYPITYSSMHLFDLVFTPTGRTDAQKINLTLSDDSYYITESGDKYKPIYEYNNIELLSKNSQVSLSTEQIKSAKQGEILTIPTYVTNAKYFNVKHFQYKLSYDKDIFENASITPGDVCNTSPDIFVSDNDTENATVSVVYNDDYNKKYKVTKDGLLMNIVLKVKDDAPIGNTSLKNDYSFGELASCEYDSDFCMTQVYTGLLLSPIAITEK